MQNYILILVFLIHALNTKAQIADDFTDGDFTKNPRWEGDSSHFEINTAGQLHLISSGTDTSFLVTPNSGIEKTEWSFWVKLSFNTSVNNNAKVYLVSDQSNLKGPLNGYYLQIGGSDDSVTFIKQAGSVREALFKGGSICSNHPTNLFRMKMIHDSTGTWSLYADDTGGMNYKEEGHFRDTGFNSTAWFGICCYYTSSNSAKFYFDDFYAGPVRVDTLPPSVDSLLLKDSTTLMISFSEIVDPSSVRDVTHYTSKANGTPVLAMPDPADGKKAVLVFQQPFPDEILDTLIIYGIGDPAGNIMPETIIPWSRHGVKARDIIMDEIMADPDPDNGLPASEYVELYNRTRFPIDLCGWTFTCGSSSKTFPPVMIEPHGFLILTRGIVMNYYGHCVDLFTSNSTLPNDGTTLVLKDASGMIIHSVDYTSGWYQDPLKVDGGWSLEMIDTDNPCGCQDNWIASTDKKGGTPGKINSVRDLNPDSKLPYLKRAVVSSDSTIGILFSESMDSASLGSENHWRLNGYAGSLEIRVNPPLFNSATLKLPVPIDKKHIYTLSCQNPPADCAGNLLDTIHSLRIGLPDSIFPGDIVINEILPDPFAGGKKFIELFNCSEKILNLPELALGSFDTTQHTTSDLKPLSETGFILFPGDYSVLTTDPADILKRYESPDPDAFVGMSSFPSLDAGSGTVVIARKSDGFLIDRVGYSRVMYSDLLTSTDGVSLERLSPFLPSGDIANWHSASESCGFATPGYLNSEFLRPDNCVDGVDLVPEIFTPDDDGKDDVLLVTFKLNEPGFLANITIFDAAGNRIRCLARNRLLSTKDGIIWDGRDDRNRKPAVGIYIFYVELFQPEGKVLHIKKTCVIGGKR